MLDNVLSSQTKLLALFFVSSFLYQLGFWSTFDLSVLGLFNFNDILNSFIFPVAIVLPVVIVLGIVFDIAEKEGRPRWKNLIPPLVIIMVAVLLLFLFNEWLSNVIGSFRWIAYILFFYTALDFNWLKNTLNNLQHNQTIIKIVVYTPLICFCIGKFQADDIFHNNTIKHIEMIPSDSISKKMYENLKLVSIMSDYIILSDTNNKEISILKAQDIKISQPENSQTSARMQNGF